MDAFKGCILDHGSCLSVEVVEVAPIFSNRKKFYTVIFEVKNASKILQSLWPSFSPNMISAF